MNHEDHAHNQPISNQSMTQELKQYTLLYAVAVFEQTIPAWLWGKVKVKYLLFRRCSTAS